jgi:hypothetical protein
VSRDEVRPCFRCGRCRPFERHHPLCRDEHRRYVRPAFLRHYCVGCHLAVTALLRSVGLEQPQPVTGLRIVGQLAVDFGDLALARRSMTFEPEDLEHVAEALELAHRLLREEREREDDS